MCLLRLRYTSFCLYCDKYFCLWTFIRQVNPSVAPAAVLEGETELLVHDTNVKSTQTDRKRATTVRLYLMFSLWHPQHATPQRFDVFCGVCMFSERTTEITFVDTTRAAEQREVFTLRGLSLNDASCHRVILGQQECERCSLLPPPSCSYTRRPTLGPKVLLVGASPCTWAHTLVHERVCLCGVFCIAVAQSEVMRARLSSRERRE